MWKRCQYKMAINMRILLPEGCYHYDIVVNIVEMPILQIPEDVVNMKIICTVLIKERVRQLTYPTLESAAHNESSAMHLWWIIGKKIIISTIFNVGQISKLKRGIIPRKKNKSISCGYAYLHSLSLIHVTLQSLTKVSVERFKRSCADKNN